MRRSVRTISGWAALGLLGLVSFNGLPAATCQAQEKKAANSIAGVWKGNIEITPAVTLAAVIHVKGEGDKLSATFDSPDQGAFGLPIDSVSLKGTEFEFEMKRIGGSYKGKLDAKSETITGTWSQLGRDSKLVLTRSKESDVPKAVKLEGPDRDKVAGIWQGSMKVTPVISLRMVFQVKVDKDGAVAGTLQSPDQSPVRIPMNSVSFKDGIATFEVKQVLGKFEGRINDKGSELIGKWTQNEQEFPLTLSKTEKVEEPKRPQTPKPPFSYEVEDVSIENRAAGLKLSGTFTKPKGNGPFPAAIMITGSGPQDRDETLFAHRPFFLIADALSRRGIAVLRCDDRGAGASTGDFMKATTVDFAGDVKAQVAYLKSRPDVAVGKIGLIGHSEGGLIAPMVAAGDPSIAFAVLLAGPGLDGAEILRLQNALILKAMGASEPVIQDAVTTLSETIKILLANQDDKVVDQKLADFLKQKIKAQLKTATESSKTPKSDEAIKKLEADALEKSKAQLARLRTPWMKYFLGYDPRPTLRKVHCPLLAINGEKDLQVPPGENLAEITKALESAGNKRFETANLPNLNHLFQNCKTGSPTEYGTIEETFDPAALKRIVDWVVKTTETKS